tara:strand:- start:340 stop:504 length:165 start_codon:yes stop_codon:yes gene_type:complete
MSDLENSFLGENSRKISFQLRLTIYKQISNFSSKVMSILYLNSFENRIDFSDDI